MARFELDPSLEKELLRSDEVRALTRRRTEAVADRARELAPDDPDTGRPDIRTGIEVEVDLDDAGRIRGRVNARDWKSHFWEFGHLGPDGRSREKPFLRPAAEAEGLEVERERRR